MSSGGESNAEGDRGEHHRRYDPATDSPTVAVAQAVADVLDTDQSELPALYESIDPDALDDLLGDGDRPGVTVSFAYSGVEVTVTGDGHLWLRHE